MVQFADGKVDSRDELYYTSAEDNCNLTVDAVKRAVRFLETQDAPKIDGWYVGIIHPYCKYDLMKDPDWKNPPRVRRHRERIPERDRRALWRALRPVQPGQGILRC